MNAITQKDSQIWATTENLTRVKVNPTTIEEVNKGSATVYILNKIPSKTGQTWLLVGTK